MLFCSVGVLFQLSLGLFSPTNFQKKEIVIDDDYAFCSLIKVHFDLGDRGDGGGGSGRGSGTGGNSEDGEIDGESGGDSGVARKSVGGGGGGKVGHQVTELDAGEQSYG